MNTIILLTGCINPNGMPFTRLSDSNERQKQYVEAIQFYLKKTNYKIVFCENSGTDIQPIFDNEEHRLEILTFHGNLDKKRGKGYGEAEIIEHAILKSSFIQDDSIVIKITGRLIVNNINNIIKSLRNKHEFVTCLFHSDLKFADSRIICASTSFYWYFLKKKDHINDSIGSFFEHILASTVIESPTRFIPFDEEPLITGISGTTGKIYQGLQINSRRRLLFKCFSHYNTESN